MSLVFQCGSNASQARLFGAVRLSRHGTVIGRAETVEDYDIAFDVWSASNGCAASDLVPRPGRKAWGVLYDIPDDFIRGERRDGERTLAQIEGPGYEEKKILIRWPGRDPEEAITFLVKPDKRTAGLFTSAQYVTWIVSGLREQGAPEAYVQHVIDLALQTNLAAGTASQAQNALIERLRGAAP
ncbi:MAG: hypothetical protein ACRD1X_08980 [Vicinamibacteria bacterium]